MVKKLREAGIDYIEFLVKEIYVEQENGITVKIKEIKGKGRHEINIDEIWYYATFKELDEQLVRLISKWCVQQTRSGRYVLKV